MKNNNNNNATTSNNQPDNQNTTQTNQTRTNQTRTNLINDYSNLSANGQQIKWLIFDSDQTPYKIAKETGVPDGNLYLVKSGKRSIENLSFSVASKLTEYAIKLQDARTNDND